MRSFVLILWPTILLTLITARYYHRLRVIRLEKSFCTAYQELKDNKCSARLSRCSALTPRELRTMRQLLCGFKFDPAAQTDPPAPQPNDVPSRNNFPNLYPNGYPKHFADVFEADIHSYRFIASIYSEDRKYLCTGALVSPRTVITSAQCLTGKGGDKRRKRQEEEEPPVEQTPEGDGGGGPGPGGPGGKLFVRFGEQHLNINPTFKNVYEYDVQNVIINPRYNEMTNENDIAILRLANPVPICLFPPIHIPRRFEWWLDYHHIAGCSATYLGWGLKNQKPYFRALSGEVLSPYFCEKLFNWEPNQLSSSHLCVDSPSGVCISDTGGPLITYANNHWVLIGIMTFGKHCRTPGLPLIFSRITEFIDDIHKYVEEDFHSRNATLLHEECHPHHPGTHLYPIKGYGPKLPAPPLIHGIPHDIHNIHDSSHSAKGIYDIPHALHETAHALHGSVLPIHHIDFDHL